MRFVSEIFSLPDGHFTLLRDLIHERIGVNYDNERRDLLAEKLTPRVIACGLDSFLDYYYFLKYDDAAEQEWKQVMDAISIQETFFWREMDQIRALVEVLVPEHFTAHPTECLRIWSAACASGEEPLSIAMALNEKGWFARAPIEIYASDGSPSAIAKARQGVYRDRSFRNLPPHLQTKYFREEQENQWRVVPELHSRIKWTTANLMAESEIQHLATANIIFCRNVFIYFSEKAIYQTVRAFSKTMPTPGYLCVAASESLLKLTTEFELQEIENAFIYVKR
ncbi:protein-glutamate O-methyltransferase CheR [Planktothrix sp. FACHB-1355]|uniref:protein-glutamate O-methyltransferase n=1 Tax=Aerosakkonema funiforme FACHB-1375 TaxID=2949571 RepID=A0A926ZI48_9CYAN|nr:MULTISPECIES: protein-glutamate O-methyltransferase CheR [Oscillatoriales]MBD2182872.1 protein-glutamate O-methyltransferase CheR [Aerosakkonema funiforme FACHB-1375]MBD3558249.1 protein-glutamate O-methyltransferase CheR [Planktothrix sp. FACHB-1355]